METALDEIAVEHLRFAANHSELALGGKVSFPEVGRCCTFAHSPKFDLVMIATKTAVKIVRWADFEHDPHVLSTTEGAIEIPVHGTLLALSRDELWLAVAKTTPPSRVSIFSLENVVRSRGKCEAVCVLATDGTPAGPALADVCWVPIGGAGNGALVMLGANGALVAARVSGDAIGEQDIAPALETLRVPNYDPPKCCAIAAGPSDGTLLCGLSTGQLAVVDMSTGSLLRAFPRPSNLDDDFEARFVLCPPRHGPASPTTFLVGFCPSALGGAHDVGDGGDDDDDVQCHCALYECGGAPEAAIWFAKSFTVASKDEINGALCFHATFVDEPNASVAVFATNASDDVAVLVQANAPRKWTWADLPASYAPKPPGQDDRICGMGMVLTSTRNVPPSLCGVDDLSDKLAHFLPCPTLVMSLNNDHLATFAAVDVRASSHGVPTPRPSIAQPCDILDVPITTSKTLLPNTASNSEQQLRAATTREPAFGPIAPASRVTVPGSSVKPNKLFAARSADAFVENLTAGIAKHVGMLGAQHASVSRVTVAAATQFPVADREVESMLQAATPAAALEFRCIHSLVERQNRAVDRCRTAKRLNEEARDLMRALQSAEYVELLSAVPLDEEARRKQSDFLDAENTIRHAVRELDARVHSLELGVDPRWKATDVVAATVRRITHI